MFLSDLVKRRLTSLLRPWLLEEPDLELNLGFLRSQAIANNLRFNTSVLNQLLDDTSRFIFKEVTVEYVGIRVSYWSSPAFEFQVRGVHVTIAAREERGRIRNFKDSSLDDLKKALSAIDSEASALHAILERVCTITSRNSVQTSISDLALKHCRLQMHGIHLQVQFPVTDDCFTCLFEAKELNVASEYLEHGCFIKGFVGAICLPMQNSSFVFDCKGFEVGVRRKDNVNTVLTSTGVLTCIKLKELQVVNCNISVPESRFYISPTDFALLLIVNEYLCKGKCGRSGGQLWKLVRSKNLHLVTTPRLKLHVLVDKVGLWLRYVITCEQLLRLVGYSSNSLLRRSTVKMAKDEKFSGAVRQCWMVVSEIERELPPEFIAQALRIARYRSALDTQSVEDGQDKSLVNGHLNCLWMFFRLLSLIWKTICSILYLVVQILCIRFLVQHQGIRRLEKASEESCSLYFLGLKLGNISITINPINADKPHISAKLKSRTGIPQLELLSFCILIDNVFLRHADDVYEQSLAVSCGNLKVISSSVLGTAAIDSDKKDGTISKGKWQGRSNELQTILQSEPAETLSSLGNSAGKHVEGTCFLQKVLQDLWLNWKKSCMISEKCETQYLEDPFFLLEFKISIGDSSLENTDFWCCKCGLTVGKLKLNLGLSSILSIVLIFNQVQSVLSYTVDNKTERIRPPSLGRHKGTPDSYWGDRYSTSISRIKMEIQRMLPEKYLQIGVLIAGPCIRVSLRNEDFHGGKKDFRYITDKDIHFALDIDNIEAAVWPSSKLEFASSTGHPQSDDKSAEWHNLKDLQMINIPKSDNEDFVSWGHISLGSYMSLNGLNGCFELPTRDQQCQLFVLNPVDLELSTGREYLHSFSSTVVAFSTAFYGMAMGFGISLYMDELEIISEVLIGTYSILSHALTRLHSLGLLHCQEQMKQNVPLAEPDNQTTIQGAPLICKDILFTINGSFDLKSLDIIVHNYRKSNSAEIDRYLSDSGIWILIPKIYAEISCKEERLKLSSDLASMQIVTFRYQNQTGKSTHPSELRKRLQQFLDCMHEVSLSRCTVTLCLGAHQNASSLRNARDGLDVSESVNKASYPEEASPSIVEMFSSPFSSQNERDSRSYVFLPHSSVWLLINFELSEIFIAGCSVKNVLLGAHQSNKVLSSLSVKAEFQRILLGIQGAGIFLEGKALVMLCGCFASYHDCVTHLLSEISLSREQADLGGNITRQNGNLTDEYAQFMPSTSQQAELHALEDFALDLSQFSLVFLNEDEPDRVRELVLQADVNLKLEVANTRRKFLFDLSRLSVYSQILYTSTETEVHIPVLSSILSNDVPSDLISGDYSKTFHPMEEIRPDVEGASSSDPSCMKESHQLSCQSSILEHFAVVISVEKPELRKESNTPFLKPELRKENNTSFSQNWVGGGSVSGCDITISLSEIQFILSMAASFSEVINTDKSPDMKPRDCRDQDSDNCLYEAVHDGAIVAIQDVHQHMYFAVESVQNKYSLRGAVHYSLVGERALFRVKYQKQRKWKLDGLWFSLISLYAKSDSGEPLRLNYRSGFDFLDVSSTNDNGWALWKALSYKPESFEDDLEWEPYNKLAKHSIYLINKKNDCSVAFIEDIPEFVGKPGNPIKFKVFHDLSIACNVKMFNSYPTEGSGSDEHCNVPVVKSRTLQTGILPSIDIKFEKVTLTIVHELPGRNDKFLLLRGRIDNIQLIVQILASKARVISTLTAVLTYFDARRNLWRELVPPVEISTFYRSNFQGQAADTVLHRVPLHLYCRLKGLDINLTELSLDILLFVIGELNLAGPYSVKSSMILANCCKVENQTAINVVCHFYDNQHITIARRHTASIYLRPLADRPENAPFVSIQLAMFGAFSTSPIHISEGRSLAWRTRIVSLKDSRAYPGPFVVADISREIEDGLTIVVSPLIKVHNATELPIEVRFERPQQKEAEFFSVLLKPGDTFDDCGAIFDALSLSGGTKKALMSLSVGNFLFSFRPQITDERISQQSISVEWSDQLKGGKAVRLSGLFDKLSYRIHKAFSVDPVKYSFTTTHCSVKSEGALFSDMHFLIQTIGRDVPVVRPDSRDNPDNKNLPVALQEQKEIFLLPTIRVSNLLQSEIQVLLTDKNSGPSLRQEIGNQATIPSGSDFDFFANPAVIYFTFTLTELNLRCKPVSSSDWVKRLQKQKKDVRSLDIELDFGGGRYSALLRLSREHRGMLEAVVFTSYTLQNDTNLTLYFFPPNQKPLSRDDVQKFGSGIPPELGLVLPSKSTGSWFSKSNKLHLKLLEENSYEELLDLEALSGLTEISLKREEESGFVYVTKLGVSLGPQLSKMVVPSRTVTVVPRYLIVNESKEAIMVRQCYLEDDTEGIIHVTSGQKSTLQLRHVIGKRKQISFFDNFVKKHGSNNDDLSIHIQFQLSESGFDWSGPVCIASLGRFFLKFRKSLDTHGRKSNKMTKEDAKLREFAAVHVIQEGSTLVLHFRKPPDVNLPYRIENTLHNFSIAYYQKDSSEPEILGSESSVDYVWDDLTRAHKLVVQISDMNLLREINLDKLRSWKPFSKSRQKRGLATPLVFEKRKNKTSINFGESTEMEMVKVGYEVWADGPTRVLRICEYSGSHKGNTALQSTAKYRLRVSSFAIHFLEDGKQVLDMKETMEPSIQTPIIIARLGNIILDSLLTDQHNYYRIKVQSLNVEQKLAGAPFAAMIRKHQFNLNDTSDCILHVAFIILSTSSNVKQVKYSSIVLQPIDFNLDEETLMRIAPFWRSSLSDSNTPSRQFYFDHFEIHPIKVIASFSPGDSYSSYSTTQETLRSLLHSVIKVPAMKNMVVELNGVMVTHALITTRELLIKCAQHYSWYAMRAIYIAKGSPLLPPVFTSIFDDLASSSLDVFFDPSRRLVSLPGLTLGTFRLISKCIDAKGFSGTKRYFGDLAKTLRTAGSNVLFATVTEISDSILKGAETSGVQGMVSGFHQGILRLAMEPSVLGTVFMEGGPDRKIKLDRSPGVDELYIEGYLQAMLDIIYKQEYLRVRVIDDQVFLKNLPPNSSLIDEIMDRVKGFLISKALLKGDSSTYRPLRQLRGEREWKIGPTVLTLCEHLFVSFAIRMLRKQAGKFIGRIKLKERSDRDGRKAIVPATSTPVQEGAKGKLSWKWGISKFVLSGIVAYVDGRLCRCIPNPELVEIHEQL